MAISLIFTVKNEAGSLPGLLDSILAQTRVPDEIVVVDGGSTDNTLAILHDYARRLPLKIICEPSNISRGRNIAIRAASGDIICSTDAGVRLDPGWVAELTSPFDRRPQTADHERSLGGSRLRSAVVDVVAGFFVPDSHGVFETALAATTLPALADIRPAKFMPSSRSVAFRKSAWAQVNGYPEWLDFCEDLIFDFALRDAGFAFAFAPQAVAHFRPRHSLRAFFKQYYQYARGDGKANLFFRRHLIRYATYLIALPLLIGLTIIAPLWSMPLWLFAAAFMFYTPYKRLLPMSPQLSWLDKLCVIAWVPVIRITGDVAKMIGYPVGVRWRMKNRRAR